MKSQVSRRSFVASLTPLLWGNAQAAPAKGAAHGIIPLDTDWQFAGNSVTLPHCVTKLSWQDWDPASWERVWNYQRRFSLPAEFRRSRVFLQFDGVMVGATPSINGHALPEHLGGYLPFRYEITEWLKDGENLLDLAVDSQWKNVPPEGSPKGPRSIDYLEPGGITRPVSLYAVPQIFLSDVFAKPVKVLDADRHVAVTCTIDAAAIPDRPVQIKVALLAAGKVVSVVQQTVKIQAAGKTEVELTLANLGNIALWDVASPHLYEVVATLSVDGRPVHDYHSRIGFRDARFELDGFFLNGSKLQFMGLDRHEIYPYVGAAMPRRVLRRDAEILRREFNCNMVRCSHYPQSEAFLDACDELGLMVWEEIPGWQYLGNDAWKELALRDTREMITRDRNHPSIVIWGVRINESANDPELYTRTREIAHKLDDSRPTSGSMTPSSLKTWKESWHQDVFAFDDYHSSPDKTVGILEPLPGVPYMLAETVGQFNYAKGRVFDAKYRRIADVKLQQAQAIRHAQAYDRAIAFPRMAGVIAWCAFDYGSLINADHNVKCPGVADVFRIPKLGAAFYQSQVSPKVRAVLEPNFYWPLGTGNDALVFSNCENLEIFLDGKKIAAVSPDRAGYPHLLYPPFPCNVPVEEGRTPDLRIDGYVGGKVVISKSFSADPSKDQFFLAADDEEISGDSSDATRVWFKTVDRFGQLRAFAGGEVKFEIAGPGLLVGDNPFQLTDSGGVGAVWIKARPKSTGRITVTAMHSALGAKSVTVRVTS